MTDTANKVLLGFSNLSRDDQQEVINEILNFLEAADVDRRKLQDKFRREAGVLASRVANHNCPCCGR